jgi:hypothetical protein
MGTYSPGWIGNGWNRYEWAAVGSPSISILLQGYEFAR